MRPQILQMTASLVVVTLGACAVETPNPAGQQSAALEGRFRFERKFVYDRQDRLDRIESTIGDMSWTLDYDFDERGNVSQVSDDLRNNLHHQYFYDENDRIEKATGFGSGDIDYTYLKNGAISTVTTMSGSTPLVETYQYVSVGHQLQSIQSSAGTRTFTYDNDGNRCSASLAGTTYQSLLWNGDGTLASVQNQSGPASHYAYDHTGNRWKATRWGGEDVSIYLDELEVTRDGMHLNLALPGGVTCTVSADPPCRCFFEDDRHAVAVYDPAAEQLMLADYTPYGVKTVIAGQNRPEFDFHNKRREPGGLVHFGKRTYDPSTRQWLSPDPMRTAGATDTIASLNTLQPYTFISGNPTTYRDPLGLNPKHRDSSVDWRKDTPRWVQGIAFLFGADAVMDWSQDRANNLNKALAADDKLELSQEMAKTIVGAPETALKHAEKLLKRIQNPVQQATSELKDYVKEKAKGKAKKVIKKLLGPAGKPGGDGFPAENSVEEQIKDKVLDKVLDKALDKATDFFFPGETGT